MKQTTDGGVELLHRYQAAMRAFNADMLADLYAPDAVHEFGFFTPGPTVYKGREEVRDAYRRTWRQPRVILGEIRNEAVHESATGAVISEWRSTATTGTGSSFELAGVLVIESAGGLITRVRDYVDVLGLAHGTGTVGGLAAALSRDAA
jgi:ketosteroid isomerase-like protein